MASILVVDDDADSRDVVQSYFVKAGHKVRSAANGRAALKSLTAKVPDVVILDLIMPEMSGVEFLRVIRGYLRWQRVPVIVTTGYPDGPDVREAQGMGVTGFFSKGDFQLADLGACVNALACTPPSPSSAPEPPA